AIDPLTSLYNRRYLEERFDQEISSCQRHQHLLSCFMIDIDDFKFVNDHYGHPFGDYVLAEVAQLIEDSCRIGDVVSRFGGEEFFVLLPQTNPKGALILGERVRENIDKHIFQFDKYILHLTVSIGITTTTNDMPQDHCQQTLVKQADTALYQAKRNGKNQIVEWQVSP
ncbi:MAG TPA: GGDEF domain-containing protein, partial [Spirochaetes bacterium]|nr:GGDEF domain-containing protein [Spirochaetota bacterium]